MGGVWGVRAPPMLSAFITFIRAQRHARVVFSQGRSGRVSTLGECGGTGSPLDEYGRLAGGGWGGGDFKGRHEASPGIDWPCDTPGPLASLGAGTGGGRPGLGQASPALGEASWGLLPFGGGSGSRRAPRQGPDVAARAGCRWGQGGSGPRAAYSRMRRRVAMPRKQIWGGEGGGDAGLRVSAGLGV